MENLYKNYLNRKPSPFGEHLVRRWHLKMINKVSDFARTDWSGIKCAEYGPGHGYFAGIVKSLGCDYRFIDNSDLVIDAMTEKGFQQVERGMESFDVIWLSHVLEHSTDWIAARQMLQDSALLARSGGMVVVIAPDFLNWGKRFFDTDATHGYPTTLRTVAQLMNDVGIDVVCARYHRGGYFTLLPRTVCALLSIIPVSVGRLFLARGRLKSDDHPFYSWKAVLGWRQILVVGRVTA